MNIFKKGIKIKVFDEFNEPIGSFKGDVQKSEEWFDKIRRKMS